MNGFRDICGGIERNVIGHSLRETVANLLHLRPDILRHFHGICARKHIDIDHRGITSVNSTLRVIRLSLERDTSHIP